MAPIVEDSRNISDLDCLLMNSNENMFYNAIDNKRICLDCTEADMEKRSLDLNKNEIENKSKLQDFYSGKNILVTGATGFLGKVLIEKLLRSCPDLENLYLLVRPKRGKDIYTRVDELFDDPVFTRLKSEQPKFRHKIVPIPADCNSPDLGLSSSDRDMLIHKINIVFHSAATVKFDEHLRIALVTNVRAPLQLLRLARDMKELDVLMHVSTAYSNCHLPLIEEKFYPCKDDCEELSSRIDKMTDSEIDRELPTILGPWPNTYTFTKALAERALKTNAGNLPIGIFRPAIVTSTAKEPLECWIDNMYGPTGVAVGAATGVLRTIHCDSSKIAEIVPVDFVVNCLLAAGRDVYTAYSAIEPPTEPPIYNYVSSVENKLTWGTFMKYNVDRIHDNPLCSAVWYISLTLHKSAYVNAIYVLFLHLLPAMLIDGLAMCLGKEPKMLKVYRKIHKFSSVLSYFCTREFRFCNRRTRQLWDETNDEDRKIFPFSMSSISWSEYFSTYLTGIRRYIFKEDDDTLPKAKVKWQRLYYLHQIVRIIFAGIALYTIWSVVKLIL